jgi:hypothetical protein
VVADKTTDGVAKQLGHAKSDTLGGEAPRLKDEDFLSREMWLLGQIEGQYRGLSAAWRGLENGHLIVAYRLSDGVQVLNDRKRLYG